MICKKLLLQNGLTINYYEAGQGGSTIILLHGAGVDSAMLSWGEVIPLLAAKGLRVIAPDLPGYGDSDRISGDYSLLFYSSVISEFIRTIQNGPVILSGLSLGGGITLQIALENPQLLSAIIPVDAWGLFDKLPWHRTVHWFVNSRFNKNLYSWSGKSRLIIKWSLTSNLFGDKSKVTEELLDSVLEAMRQPDAGEPFRSFQLSELTKTGVSTDLFGRLKEIRLPTLIVHGEKDMAVPLAGAIEAQKRIENAKLHIMKGCRHWPQRENPQEFAEAVVSFLGSEKIVLSGG